MPHDQHRGVEAHVPLDREGRERKARKIERVLSAHTSLEGARVLEIGTGSGVIAACLAEAVGPSGSVVAVDVDDHRIVQEGFDYQLIDGVTLPFDEDSFDVVVSNHVLEHVGDDGAQVLHLREIARTLAPRGLGYLAVPNRYRFVEAHFKLPFLSWVPEGVASGYVRLARRGDRYDVNPPSARTLEGLIARAGLESTDVTYEQMRIMAEVEAPSTAGRALLRSPHWVYRIASPVIPTMVRLVRPA